MRWLLLLTVIATSLLTGCCTSLSTSVRNETGQNIKITYTQQSKEIQTITIPASAHGRCPGLIGSWVIAVGNTQYTYENLSPILSMPGEFKSSARFSHDFPCKRVTAHVRLTADMAIHASRVIGYTESEPPGFPIHFTSQKTAN